MAPQAPRDEFTQANLFIGSYEFRLPWMAVQWTRFSKVQGRLVGAGGGLWISALGGGIGGVTEPSIFKGPTGGVLGLLISDGTSSPVFPWICTGPGIEFSVLVC
jgi:hypothetical protein